jgi:O-antigen ligase
MIKILVLIAIAMSILLVISAPYVAAILYATVSLLQPHHVWFWAFEGISIFKISAGIAIVAWFFQMFRGLINWQVYNNGIFYGMVIICIIYYLSEFFSPFPNYSSMVGSTIVVEVYTSILIMAFVTLGLINNQTALKYLVWTLIGATLYYTFWSNSAYFENNWAQFTSNRLNGPFGSPYRDGNIFSVLFVIGIPFVIFAIYNVDKKWQKLIFLFSIPFIWHALILCASRGALLSAGVSTLVVAWMIKSKGFNMILLAGIAIFIVDQGGEILSRTTDTIQRVGVSSEEPLNPRFLSWQAGVQLIQKHPLLGVGPQRFLEASHFYFPGKTPHVAHNTFLNFAANIGLTAGIIYLSFFWVSRKMYKWNKKALEKYPSKFHTYVNKSSICSLIGFFVGAMFLDLIIFEPFYFLLLIIILNHVLLKQKVALASADVETQKTTNMFNQTAFAKVKHLST